MGRRWARTSDASGCSIQKNSLFARSDERGENRASMASPIETCKLNDVNPLTYMTELRTRLVNASTVGPWVASTN
jgi:hypothetical protein